MKIESRELKMMGATDAQISAYCNTSPLNFYREDDGSYSASGIYELGNLKKRDVLDILDDLVYWGN